MKRIQKWIGGAGCAVALFVAGCASDGNSRSTGQFIDDTAILAKTKAALVNDPVVAGMAVNVDVNRGMVTLNGAVNGAVEKQKAEEIARGVDGVRGVQNNLVVRSEAAGSAPGATVKGSVDTDKDVKTKVNVHNDDKRIDTEVKVK